MNTEMYLGQLAEVNIDRQVNGKILMKGIIYALNVDPTDLEGLISISLLKGVALKIAS